jgi:hypothetical protein
MQNANRNQVERRLPMSVAVRALFGVALMCVSSLGAVQQRALAFQEESEILEMRHDLDRVRVRAKAGHCAPRNHYEEVVVCCRVFDAAAGRLPGASPVIGHCLSNGLAAPLVC